MCIVMLIKRYAYAYARLMPWVVVCDGPGEGTHIGKGYGDVPRS